MCCPCIRALETKSSSVTPVGRCFRHTDIERACRQAPDGGHSPRTDLPPCQGKVPEKCSVTQIRSSLLCADSLIHVPNVSLTFRTWVGLPMEAIMDSTKGRERKITHLPARTLRHPISEFQNKTLCSMYLLVENGDPRPSHQLFQPRCHRSV